MLAVITAMHVHDGNFEITSDSQYAVRIATRRSRGEMQKGNEGNADLWEEFETLLKRNISRRLGCVWVKGYATKVHIDRQITTSLNKGSDDAADALASAAAAFHAAPQSLTDAAIDRHRTAWDTHSFAAELLFGRRVAFLALHEADFSKILFASSAGMKPIGLIMRQGL